MDSPFIFRGFPRLSILFYTIFHKKASEKQKGKDCLAITLFLVVSIPYSLFNLKKTPLFLTFGV